MLTPLLGSLHWLLLKTRRKFRHLCLGKGAFHSLAPALRPHSSLTPSISRERLGYAALRILTSQWLTPQKVSFCQCYVPTVGLQGSSVHCGHSRTPVGKGFCLTHASYYYLIITLAKGREGGKSFTGSQSIHLEVTHCSCIIGQTSHVPMPNFKSL